jgi:hypothetical protein
MALGRFGLQTESQLYFLFTLPALALEGGGACISSELDGSYFDLPFRPDLSSFSPALLRKFLSINPILRYLISLQLSVYASSQLPSTQVPALSRSPPQYYAAAELNSY